MSVKNLVIVESPGKIKSISKFLGRDFTVMASFGHVRDLPKNKMGVDIEKDFAPQYIVSPEKKKVIKELKSKVGKETTVWIATDEDREGEAIGWHLVEALGLEDGPQLKRIVFHEITEPAIKKAIDTPRSIYKNLVDAQQARRVLDRLVGYELSPLLWKKIRYGLSAGRVQSVAVRMICEREREILAFNPVEYWSLTLQFMLENGELFQAKLFKIDGKKAVLSNEEETKAIMEELKHASFQVSAVEKKETKRNPSAPFTTSTLQQEAGRKLHFSVKKTMKVAQQLYEGLDLGAGPEGLITYMRTDSTNLSDTALTQAKEAITELFGKEYALSAPRRYKSGKAAQEAHEAIRPTSLLRTPESIAKYLDKDELKLYELIWKRTMASQMATAILDKTSIDIHGGRAIFRANGQIVRFPGFMKLYMEDKDESQEEEEESTEGLLPAMKEKDALEAKNWMPKQHFTKAPPRYTEASLVKKLEEEGIGRPSTYAPTISTIQTREYIAKEGSQLYPTELGFVVNDFLMEHFPAIMEYQFTVKMEATLDEVAEGKAEWKKEIADFFHPFHAQVLSKADVAREEIIPQRDLGVDHKTGKAVSVRVGRFGPYVQLGTKDDAEKPKSASLAQGMDFHKVTLEEAMKLFDLPRLLGKDEDGEAIEVNVGRFGPYLKKGKSYFSFKDQDPYTVDLDWAKAWILEAEDRKKKAVLKEFPGHDFQVLQGPYGPYIKQGKSNFKIPKSKDPESLTLEECLELIAAPQPKSKFKKKKS